VATDSPAGKHILIVEDNEVERGWLATVLRREGYVVTTAVDGGEGLAYLRADRPDLVLLDMIQPGQDGWAFLTGRRREPRLSAVPVILVTRLGEAAPGGPRR